jgi:peroxiredoxin Q/BCP
MALIDAGKKAPAFSLKDQHGETHRLTDYVGHPIVLYFYPKDDTPGCTKEACAFRDNLPKFNASRAAVLGVSILDEKSKARFAERYDLNFPLLADANHEVSEKYGVWQKKSRYGRSYMGIVRTTYLIGSNGRVARRWDNVKVDGHAGEVGAAVDALQHHEDARSPIASPPRRNTVHSPIGRAPRPR